MKKSFSFLTVLLMAVSVWGDSWTKCSITDLTSTDVFVIVDANTGKAMTNNNGTSSAPAATAVTVAEDGNTISNVTDAMKWNISGNGTDGYTIYPNGDKEKWLYCTNSNNGLRVGTNTDKTFVIENHTNGEPFLKHVVHARYIGVYNSSDWRCYTSVNSNITATKTRFYKFVSGGSVDTRTAVNMTAFTATTTNLVLGSTTTTTTQVTNDQVGWTAAYTYSSNKESVATIDEDGTITAVGEGEATITATLNISGSDETWKKGTTSSMTLTITVTDSTPKESIKSFSATSGTLVEFISYTTAKGGGTSDPAISSSQLRLYQRASGEDYGGSITITAASGKHITAVKWTSGIVSTYCYKADEDAMSADQDVANGNVASISDLDCQSITIYARGTASSNRVYMKDLTVFYKVESGSTKTLI